VFVQISSAKDGSDSGHDDSGDSLNDETEQDWEEINLHYEPVLPVGTYIGSFYLLGGHSRLCFLYTFDICSVSIVGLCKLLN